MNSSNYYTWIFFCLSGKNVSVIIPVKGKKDQFIITMERDLMLITWDGESDELSKIEKLHEVDKNTTNVFNDGKADPAGRLWIGKNIFKSRKLTSMY